MSRLFNDDILSPFIMLPLYFPPFSRVSPLLNTLSVSVFYPHPTYPLLPVDEVCERPGYRRKTKKNF